MTFRISVLSISKSDSREEFEDDSQEQIRTIQAIKKIFTIKTF
jgi:hypothetical protein